MGEEASAVEPNKNIKCRAQAKGGPYEGEAGGWRAVHVRMYHSAFFCLKFELECANTKPCADSSQIHACTRKMHMRARMYIYFRARVRVCVGQGPAPMFYTRTRCKHKLCRVYAIVVRRAVSSPARSGSFASCAASLYP